MEIYLVRHGETEYNKNQIIQGGGIDSDLNETGLLQSDAFYSKYAAASFNLVITSTLKRTYQTVRRFIVAGIKHIATPYINELNWGIHEGKRGNSDLHLEYLALTDNWKNGNWDHKIENGESANE